MILLIDNYDSFTYNLVQYLSELGAEVLVKRNDQITVKEAVALKPERVVVSPGPCTPSEAGISIAIIKELGPKSLPSASASGISRSGRPLGASSSAPRL